MIILRRGGPDDAPELAALAERTFRYTFGPENNAGDMDDYCVTAYSPVIQRAQLVDPSIDTLVLVDEKEALVGYAQLRPGAPTAITGDSPIELWRFYLDTELHGTGAARVLMDGVIVAAAARHAETLWLGVWEHNHRARAFYRKKGFVDVGSQEFRLGSDLQTDRLMTRAVVVTRPEPS